MSTDMQTVVAHRLRQLGHDAVTFATTVGIRGAARLINCWTKTASTEHLLHRTNVELLCRGFPNYNAMYVTREITATAEQCVAYLTASPDDFADRPNEGPARPGGPTPEYIRGWLLQLRSAAEPTLEELQDFYMACAMAQEYGGRQMATRIDRSRHEAPGDSPSPLRHAGVPSEYPPPGYYRRVFERLLRDPYVDKESWHGKPPAERKWNVFVDVDLAAWRSDRLIDNNPAQRIDMLILAVAKQLAADVGITRG